MTENDDCPTCGTPLATSGPARGSCPRCLIGLGLGDAEFVRTGGGAPGEPPPSVAELAPAFPDLEIEELLGTGGMGSVYRARQRKLDRPIALKILRSDVARHPEFAERFQREARALAALSHPGIVSVHDCGRAGEWYFLLMEYVDGANLRHLLRTGRLSSKEALVLVGEICDALQYAHEHGVVHRDIKPENILVDTRGRAKIADFGLAKLHQPGRVDLTLTETTQSMGTVHYMAPEQVETPREVDHRADIYSLGVVFYELLTGELPLGRFRKPSEKVELDIRIDDIVLRSLEKEPYLRYQAAADVRTDVDALRTAAPPPPLQSGVDAELDAVDEMLRETLGEGGGLKVKRKGGVVTAGYAGGGGEGAEKKGRTPKWLQVLLFVVFLSLFLMCLLGTGAFLLLGASSFQAEESAASAQISLERAQSSLGHAPQSAELPAELTPLPPAPDGTADAQGPIVFEDGEPALSPAFVLETGMEPERTANVNAFLAGFLADYEKLLRKHLDTAELRTDGVFVRLSEFGASRRELIQRTRKLLPNLLGEEVWTKHGSRFDLAYLFPIGEHETSVTLRSFATNEGWTFVVEKQAGGGTEITTYTGELPPAYECLRAMASM